MDEQSHKEEMRAALRGDFERLRARRGGAAPPAAVGPPPQSVAPSVTAVDGGSPALENGRRGWMTRMLGRC